MANVDQEISGGGSARPEEQPPALKQLLAAVNVARKQISMYGADHPNAVEAISHISECSEEFASSFDRATCVFTSKAVIVNEHYYTGSRDSLDICQRLRARGGMAITLIGSPPVEQVAEFLRLLNTDPKEVRAQDGPSAFLRKRGVSRIVITETIYTTGDGENSQEDEAAQDWSGSDDDRIIGAVIDWLSKHDQEEEDDEPAPRIPISQVLSNPDSAARLIREAVTKLHVSRRESTGESATDVINELKSMAVDDPAEWDRVAPQVRKAMSKLPQEIRPSAIGFMFDEDDDEAAEADQRPTTCVDEAESMIHELLANTPSSEASEEPPSPAPLERLFGARAEGMLSSWRRELQPNSVLESSGRTLETLMAWESSACEHGRIAQAAAALISRALEAESFNVAFELAESLLKEANSDEELGWRRTNVKSAMSAIDPAALALLVREAAKAKTRAAGEVAASTLTLVPQVAMNLTNLLGTPEGAEIAKPLRESIRQLGHAALAPLARLLRDGSHAAREGALEILVESGRGWAVEEIAAVMKVGDPAFIIRALKFLPRVRIPLSTETCFWALSSSFPEVRSAAYTALGELQDNSALPQIIRTATRCSAFKGPSIEQIAAVSALGHFRDPEAVDCLKKIAARRPLFAGARYEPMRRAAQIALGLNGTADHDDWRKAA